MITTPTQSGNPLIESRNKSSARIAEQRRFTDLENKVTELEKELTTLKKKIAKMGATSKATETTEG